MNKNQTQHISVKLTEAELNKLNKIIEKLKISKSEYIRNIINGYYKNSYKNTNDTNLIEG